MSPLSTLFWSLVLVTAGVSYRWGAMVGLMFYALILVIGAVLASRWGLR